MTRAWRMLLPAYLLSASCVFAQAPQGSTYHEISGIVVSAKSGEPLADTSVTAILSSSRKPAAETVTDATGRFRFSDVPAGKYDLVASRRGYVTSAYQQHDGGISTAIVAGDGLISTSLLFQLEPQARIYGIIQEDSGDPVPSAQVRLFQKDIFRGTGRMVVVRAGNADSMGNYELSGLPPGSYVLCAVGTPWYALPRRPYAGMLSSSAENGLARVDVLYAPTCYPDTTIPGEAEPITVAAGEQAQVSITFHAVAATHLSIPIATKEDGQPTASPPQVNTQVFGNSEFVPTQVSMARDDPNGPYRAEIELPPGQYELTFPGQHGDPARHMSINTDSGSSTLNMTEADPDPSVTGTLRTENGESLPANSYVWLESRDGDARMAGTVNPDGTFTVQSLKPGAYNVRVSSLGAYMGIARLSAKGAQLRGRTLTLSGESVQLNIVVLRSNTRVNGIVRKGGKAAAGVFVLLVPSGAPQGGDQATPNQSDSDGTFNFLKVPPGDYTVVAIEEGWKLDWGKPETIKPYLARGEQVRVEPQMREVNLKEAVEPQTANLR